MSLLSAGPRGSVYGMPTLAALLALGLTTHGANAQDINTVNRATEAVTKATDNVCGAIALEGSTHSTKVSGEIKASIGGLSSVFKALHLPDIDASASTAIENSNYKGLRQQDIPVVMVAQIDCRKNVFAILHRDVPAPELPRVSSNTGFASPSQRIRLQPVATPGQPGWLMDEQTGCNVWDPLPVPGETVTWSGDCSGGMASGAGVVRWVAPAEGITTTAGTAIRGRIEGQATTIIEILAHPGQPVKLTGPFRDGTFVRGFSTIWLSDGSQVTGDIGPDGKAAGPIVSTTTFQWRGMNVSVRYEGTMDDRNDMNNGWRTIQAPGYPVRVQQIIHGCIDDPPGHCPR